MRLRLILGGRRYALLDFPRISPARIYFAVRWILFDSEPVLFASLAFLNFYRGREIRGKPLDESTLGMPAIIAGNFAPSFFKAPAHPEWVNGD